MLRHILAQAREKVAGATLKVKRVKGVEVVISS